MERKGIVESNCPGFSASAIELDALVIIQDPSSDVVRFGCGAGGMVLEPLG